MLYLHGDDKPKVTSLAVGRQPAAATSAELNRSRTNRRHRHPHAALSREPLKTLGGPPKSCRDYEPEAATRLGFIRAAQSIGLSLGEIREILAVRDRGQTPAPTSPG